MFSRDRRQALVPRWATSRLVAVPLATLIAGALAAALPAALAGTGAGAAAAESHLAPASVVVPVVGDQFANPGTSVTIEGVSAGDLSGLSVVGSESGRHAGHLSHLIGATGEVFTPDRPFTAGELVTVTTPHVEAPGADGDTYTFRVDHPATPAESARALAVADSNAEADGAGTARAVGTKEKTAGARQTTYGTPPACPTLTYESEPTLEAQRACMNDGVKTQGTQPGNYLFLTPGGDLGDGAGIYQTNGDLVWWDGHPGIVDYDLTVDTYRDEKYVALWVGKGSTHGAGEVLLYNEHYQLAGVVTAAGGYAAKTIDLHEFRITPQGDALVGIYDSVNETVNGKTVTVLQYVVQKLSLVQTKSGIHTGSLLFEWDSLNTVPTIDSYVGASGGVWDYFHGNAISQDSDYNLVVSSRNTWGLYKISVTTGRLIWEVGGQNCTETGGSSTPSCTPMSQLSEPWCYQHDVSALGNNRYSLFDDGSIGPGCEGPTAHPARGLIFTVTPPAPGAAPDTATVSLDQSFTHNPGYLAEATGSTELLPNGDVVVDWALVPDITEYGSNGQVKMDLSLSQWSYRGLSFNWTGLPLTKPSIHTAVTKGANTYVWMSWNGSTEVTGWELLAGPSPSHLVKQGRDVPKNEFETLACVIGEHRYVEVVALNAGGRELAASAAVPAS
jgi:hypothetical protein